MFPSLHTRTNSQNGWKEERNLQQKTKTKLYYQSQNLGKNKTEKSTNMKTKKKITTKGNNYMKGYLLYAHGCC